MKVLGDILLVYEVETIQTRSGIIIPVDRSELQLIKGVIRQKGVKAGWELEVGDTVFFYPYVKKTIEIDGEELFIMTTGDIAAVVK